MGGAVGSPKLHLGVPLWLCLVPQPALLLQAAENTWTSAGICGKWIRSWPSVRIDGFLFNQFSSSAGLRPRGLHVLSRNTPLSSVPSPWGSVVGCTHLTSVCGGACSHSQRFGGKGRRIGGV